jgi:hypothetical protein
MNMDRKPGVKLVKLEEKALDAAGGLGRVRTCDQPVMSRSLCH